MDLQEAQDRRGWRRFITLALPFVALGVLAAVALRLVASATGLAGSLCFGGWALADRLRRLPTPAVA